MYVCMCTLFDYMVPRKIYTLQVDNNDDDNDVDGLSKRLIFPIIIMMVIGVYSFLFFFL